MKFSARFGVTIPNSELLKGFKTYQRWSVFYLSEPIITDVTSLTKLKRLLSLACHLQTKTCPCGTTCCSAALSLTLYKIAFLPRLSSFVRKVLFQKTLGSSSWHWSSPLSSLLLVSSSFFNTSPAMSIWIATDAGGPSMVRFELFHED